MEMRFRLQTNKENGSSVRQKTIWQRFEQLPLFTYLCRWLILSGASGVCIGSASALLLVSLEWATNYRENHLWIIALLPVAGLVTGLMYHYVSIQL